MFFFSIVSFDCNIMWWKCGSGIYWWYFKHIHIRQKKMLQRKFVTYSGSFKWMVINIWGKKMLVTYQSNNKKVYSDNKHTIFIWIFLYVFKMCICFSNYFFCCYWTCQIYVLAKYKNIPNYFEKYTIKCWECLDTFLDF